MACLTFQIALTGPTVLAVPTSWQWCLLPHSSFFPYLLFFRSFAFLVCELWSAHFVCTVKRADSRGIVKTNSTGAFHIVHCTRLFDSDNVPDSVSTTHLVWPWRDALNSTCVGVTQFAVGLAPSATFGHIRCSVKCMAVSCKLSYMIKSGFSLNFRHWKLQRTSQIIWFRWEAICKNWLGLAIRV